MMDTVDPDFLEDFALSESSESLEEANTISTNHVKLKPCSVRLDSLTSNLRAKLEQFTPKDPYDFDGSVPDSEELKYQSKKPRRNSLPVMNSSSPKPISRPRKRKKEQSASNPRSSLSSATTSSSDATNSVPVVDLTSESHDSCDLSEAFLSVLNCDNDRAPPKRRRLSWHMTPNQTPFHRLTQRKSTPTATTLSVASIVGKVPNGVSKKCSAKKILTADDRAKLLRGKAGSKESYKILKQLKKEPQTCLENGFDAPTDANVPIDVKVPIDTDAPIDFDAPVNVNASTDFDDQEVSSVLLNSYVLKSMELAVDTAIFHATSLNEGNDSNERVTLHAAPQAAREKHPETQITLNKPRKSRPSTSAQKTFRLTELAAIVMDDEKAAAPTTDFALSDWEVKPQTTDRKPSESMSKSFKKKQRNMAVAMVVREDGEATPQTARKKPRESSSKSVQKSHYKTDVTMVVGKTPFQTTQRKPRERTSKSMQKLKCEIDLAPIVRDDGKATAQTTGLTSVVKDDTKATSQTLDIAPVVGDYVKVTAQTTDLDPVVGDNGKATPQTTGKKPAEKPLKSDQKKQRKADVTTSDREDGEATPQTTRKKPRETPSKSVRKKQVKTDVTTVLGEDGEATSQATSKKPRKSTSRSVKKTQSERDVTPVAGDNGQTTSQTTDLVSVVGDNGQATAETTNLAPVVGDNEKATPQTTGKKPRGRPSKLVKKRRRGTGLTPIAKNDDGVTRTETPPPLQLFTDLKNVVELVADKNDSGQNSKQPANDSDDMPKPGLGDFKKPVPFNENLKPNETVAMKLPDTPVVKRKVNRGQRMSSIVNNCLNKTSVSEAPRWRPSDTASISDSKLDEVVSAACTSPTQSQKNTRCRQWKRLAKLRGDRGNEASPTNESETNDSKIGEEESVLSHGVSTADQGNELIEARSPTNIEASNEHTSRWNKPIQQDDDCSDTVSKSTRSRTKLAQNSSKVAQSVATGGDNSVSAPTTIVSETSAFEQPNDTPLSDCDEDRRLRSTDPEPAAVIGATDTVKEVSEPSITRPEMAIVEYPPLDLSIREMVSPTLIPAHYSSSNANFEERVTTSFVDKSPPPMTPHSNTLPEPTSDRSSSPSSERGSAKLWMEDNDGDNDAIELMVSDDDFIKECMSERVAVGEGPQSLNRFGIDDPVVETGRPVDIDPEPQFNDLNEDVNLDVLVQMVSSMTRKSREKQNLTPVSVQVSKATVEENTSTWPLNTLQIERHDQANNDLTTVNTSSYLDDVVPRSPSNYRQSQQAPGPPSVSSYSRDDDSLDYERQDFMFRDSVVNSDRTVVERDANFLDKMVSNFSGTRQEITEPTVEESEPSSDFFSMKNEVDQFEKLINKAVALLVRKLDSYDLDFAAFDEICTLYLFNSACNLKYCSGKHKIEERHFAANSTNLFETVLYIFKNAPCPPAEFFILAFHHLVGRLVEILALVPLLFKFKLSSFEITMWEAVVHSLVLTKLERWQAIQCVLRLACSCSKEGKMIYHLIGLLGLNSGSVVNVFETVNFLLTKPMFIFPMNLLQQVVSDVVDNWPREVASYLPHLEFQLKIKEGEAGPLWRQIEQKRAEMKRASAEIKSSAPEVQCFNENHFQKLRFLVSNTFFWKKWDHLSLIISNTCYAEGGKTLNEAADVLLRHLCYAKDDVEIITEIFKFVNHSNTEEARDLKSFISRLGMTAMFFKVENKNWAAAYKFLILLVEFCGNPIKIKPFFYELDEVKVAILCSEINFYNSHFERAVGLLLDNNLVVADSSLWCTQGLPTHFELVKGTVINYLTEMADGAINDSAHALAIGVITAQKSVQEPINLMPFLEPLIANMFSLDGLYKTFSYNLYLAARNCGYILNDYNICRMLIIQTAKITNYPRAVMQDLIQACVDKFVYSPMGTEDVIIRSFMVEEEIRAYLIEWLIHYKIRHSQDTQCYFNIVIKDSTYQVVSKSRFSSKDLNMVDVSVNAVVRRIVKVIRSMGNDASYTRQSNVLILSKGTCWSLFKYLESIQG